MPGITGVSRRRKWWLRRSHPTGGASPEGNPLRAAGDRRKPGHPDMRMTERALRPPYPVARCPGDPRDDAKVWALRAEPGCAASSSPKEGASAAEKSVGAALEA
jgi:hypothetical protein